MERRNKGRVEERERQSKKEGKRSVEIEESEREK